MIWLPFLILGFFALLYPATMLGFAALLLVIPATVIVTTAKTAKELILVLKLTSFAALAYALSLAVGLFVVFF
jgi:1,4-dihydroxy-2-naphthoate octaprenyltransferase